MVGTRILTDRAPVARLPSRARPFDSWQQARPGHRTTRTSKLTQFDRDDDEGRALRAEIGINPTGGWNGPTGCLEWLPDRHHMQATLTGHAFVAWCEMQGYGSEGRIRDADEASWKSFLAGYQAAWQRADRAGRS